MAQEEKAKAYDIALKKIKMLLGTGSSCSREELEYVFPELVESEDERIRKSLIDMLKNDEKCYLKEIAWLEKQGGHAKFINGIQVGDKVTRNEDGVLVNISQLNRVTKKDEKQGEQKPNPCENCSIATNNCQNFPCAIRNGEQKPDDKVEPKFHEGEWITNGDYTWQIANVTDLDYILESQDRNIVYDTISHVDEHFHSFSIQDAKDGDVLCYKDEISLYKHDIKNCTKQETTFGGFVYHCCYDGKRFITDSLYSLTEQDKMDIRPATKEQRDTLMKATADAGYEWDAINLKLNRISQRMVSAEAKEAMYDKPAWSEEDEEMLKNVIKSCEQCGNEYAYYWLKSLKDRVQPKSEWNEEDKEMLNQIIKDYERGNESWLKGQGSLPFGNRITWLKSLRPQNRWKPSDEQMKALKHAFNDCSIAFADMKILSTLYEQLKALHRYEQDT